MSIDAATATDNSAATALTEAEIFEAHQGGKLSIASTVPLSNKRDLSIAYTPGVAEVSRAIHKQPELARTLTWAERLVVVVSDGTAVLGLGNIGASASLPVMEGKSALFKSFGDLDSIPLVLNTSDVDEIVETLVRLRPSFGAVNLEDIAAPRCFELEEKLIDALDCPVMHDDQHGTAVVALAALTNAAKVTGRSLDSLKVVVSGAGAAGIAVAEILLAAGIPDVVLLDSRGVINSTRADLAADTSSKKADIAGRSNPRGVEGGPAEALAGADVFIGVSSSKLDEAHLALMNQDAIVFALSNPDPEVLPEVAAKYAAVVATGRSDFPNQINNVLAFPGIFRGALDAGARRITPAMKLAAANAIAELAAEDLAADYIVPSPLDPRVAPAVTAAVAAAVEAE
ncbi:Malate dehydrogenase (oxaloacetate-decarboxylating) (NADP(+)) [Pseudarthrobacter chlorophenolicus A6]|uniref:Malate dehydrogenase (Oxaloacetate-decarboxylating) (NADP(+)) n=1 Tax=Pseudarthrobacter chlorophenolicus (strain ATCC 700700 / DSM 12829 / CIP 107037 / JCM 12360 / KCTC 9906 / NCIMB 13794 / A6) TaxID=452863 RepID=B8H7C5_PSECP|nr:malic enzyme-like NAD(P)-binding protein [Pseudarthrobacter chlorophenolicus]ACL41727.1 Malate dehydrogenase (oxaloacetate-decarboxylating) (NADP(+)) [Pseudarthrobacter chlorophenolicus A6]SDQ59417.1 malate dehydrogenase (oxaloacetate-decarboxylating) [Pseudarthrobacter chlorophenolicus]